LPIQVDKVQTYRPKDKLAASPGSMCFVCVLGVWLEQEKQIVKVILLGQ